MNILKKAAGAITGKSKIIPDNDSMAFRSCLDKSSKDGGGQIHLYQTKGMETGKKRANIPIENAISADDFELSIGEQYGGGDYTAKVFNNAGDLVANYRFGVAGKKKSDGDDTEKPSKKRDGDLMEIVKTLITAQAAKSDNSVSLLKDTLEIAMKLQGGKDDFKDELLAVMVNNTLNGRSPIQELAEYENLRRSIQPTVEQESGLSSLLTQLMTLITMQKIPGGATGAASLPTLMQNPQMQALLQQSGVSGPQAPQPPPAAHSAPAAYVSPGGLGGSAQVQPNTPSLGQTAPSDSPGSAGSAQHPESSPQDDFYRSFIMPFRKKVSQGVSDDALARIIIFMVQQPIVMDEEPHPAIAEIVNDLRTYNYANLSKSVDMFFSRIPEISNHKQKQAGIKDSLLRLLGGQGPANGVYGVSAPEGVNDEHDADDTAIG